jgi:alkylation response protein AidB-like acyl-CoA dehydrogenase
MDLALKPEHKAFADEIRDFARQNLSPATREKTFSGKHYDRDDHMAWQQALGRQGWLAYTWPRNTAARAGTSRNASCSRTCWPRRARRASSRSA